MTWHPPQREILDPPLLVMDDDPIWLFPFLCFAYSLEATSNFFVFIVFLAFNGHYI